MPNIWAEKVLKGEELYYYTQKLRAKLSDMEDATSGLSDALDQEIADRQQAIADEAAARAAAVEAEASARADAIEALSNELKDLKLELKIVEAADFDAEGNLEAIYADVDKSEEIEPSHNYIYLVNPNMEDDPSTSTELPNVYNEYIWTEDNGFELIGSTDVNLAELSNEDIDDIWDSVFEPDDEEP